MINLRTFVFATSEHLSNYIKKKLATGALVVLVMRKSENWHVNKGKELHLIEY